MGKLTVTKSKKIWLVALLWALVTPFQNCGPMASGPGNGQGYEGVKNPDGASGSSGSSASNNQISPPPEVTGIMIDAAEAPYHSSPMATWSKTTYEYFEQYQVAVFSWPELTRINAWSSTSQNFTQFLALTLSGGQQYVIGVRIQGPSGEGPVRYSPPWVAYLPVSN